MAVRLCRVDASPACSWASHQLEHLPFEGMTREHTRHAPARYLAGFDERQIRELELETVRRPDVRDEPRSVKVEYQRRLREPIGWDREQEAIVSFVERSGGDERWTGPEGILQEVLELLLARPVASTAVASAIGQRGHG